MKNSKLVIVFLSISLMALACSKDKNTDTKEDSILTYTNIRIYNQNNGNSFINLKSGKVYNFEDAYAHQDEIDLAFLHDFGYGALVSPAWVSNNYPNTKTNLKTGTGVKYWSNPLHTEIDRCEEKTPVQFDNVQNQRQLKALFGQCGAVMGVAEHDIKKDYIIRFTTAKNKLGIIKINKVQGSENSEGFVELDIKIQK